MRRVFVPALTGLMLSVCAPSVLAEDVSLKQGDLTLMGNLELAQGKKPADGMILITHGTLAHNRMEIIANLQKLLKDKGYNSLAINLSYAQDKRPSAMYDCPTPHFHKHTDAVEEIGAWVGWLKSQGARDVVVVGHSRGGNQTARYVVGAPDAVVSKAVLLAPATWTAGYNEKDYKERYGVDLKPLVGKAQTLVKEGKGRELIDMSFIYCEGTRASADAVLSYYLDDPKMDTPTLLPEVKVPTLVVVAGEDSVVKGLREGASAKADGKKVQVVTIDGADHMFMDLYIEEAADKLVEFTKAK